MYNKNNTGLNAESCGTPQEVTSFLKIYGLDCIVCCLFLRFFYAFSPGRNYILGSYWTAVPELVYWAMKKHGHEIDLQ